MSMVELEYEYADGFWDYYSYFRDKNSLDIQNSLHLNELDSDLLVDCLF